MPWVGYLAVGVAGLLIGWLLAAVLIRRADAFRLGPVAADAELAAEVVRHSDTGFVVTDLDGNVLLSNARAVELRAVRAGMCDSRIAAAIERTVISGEPIDVELDHLDPPPAGDADAVVRAVVEPLAQEWVLISVVDESAARQVETIRRDFVANVSHELKTPVGAMALLAEAVLDAADDEESVRHFSAKMLREATRLGALVGELIALSRLQGGIGVQDLAVVEIDAVIAEAIGRLATSAENAGIDIVTDTPTGLLVRGDRTLLVTALTNLIDNAISYSPAHTSVSVARRRTTEGVQISVTDRGVGIAPEHQRRVFERFFRVDPARSRSTGGTGLGLAIVKHVAANHGGRALLWSKVGTGSTFTLQLPALAGDDPPPDHADPLGPARVAALAPAVRTEGAS